MYEYCIRCGKKLDFTADDMQRGLCSKCRWETDNSLQSNNETVVVINPTEEKLTFAIDQLNNIINLLYEIKDEK